MLRLIRRTMKCFFTSSTMKLNRTQALYVSPEELDISYSSMINHSMEVFLINTTPWKLDRVIVACIWEDTL